MKMPTIRRMWTFYKRTVLQEGLGITQRNEMTVVAQNAFYLGAQSTLQALAALLENGDEDQVRQVLERHRRRLRKMRAKERKRRH